MEITGVEISQYRYCHNQARHLATVCMTMPDRIITMFCRVDLPEDEAPVRRTDAFMRDAARQLLRMPEFRSGDNSVAFPPANLSEPSPSLA